MRAVAHDVVACVKESETTGSIGLGGNGAYTMHDLHSRSRGELRSYIMLLCPCNTSRCTFDPSTPLSISAGPPSVSLYFSYTQSCPACFQLLISSFLNQRSISFFADSTASEPWQTLRPTSCSKTKISLILPRTQRRGEKCKAYDSEISTDRARGRSHRVRGSEQLAADFDGFAALPDHGADGAAAHVYPPSLSVHALHQAG